jgi:hypothetical protein
MREDTITDAERYARLIADEVAALERGELDGYDPEDLDDGDVVGTWLNDRALDVEVARSLTTGDVTAVEVTRTIGGPGCWITFRAWSDEVEVVAAWGGDRATQYVAAPTVADYLVDYAEAVPA